MTHFVEVNTPQEALLVEQTLAMPREFTRRVLDGDTLRRHAQEAPAGYNAAARLPSRRPGASPRRPATWNF